MHYLALADLRRLCVDKFPLSKTREKIMTGLETVVGFFAKKRIRQAFWIDGSFTTEKIDPSDVDIVIPIQESGFAQLSQAQKDVVLWYLNEDLKPIYKVENYGFFEYPSGHKDFDKGQIARDYWLDTYGKDRDGYTKGIAVITS